MTNFNFRAPARIVSEAGGIARLGEFASELGMRRPLIVCDPGIVAYGIASRARESLEAAGLETFVFDAVEADPPAAMVRRSVAMAQSVEADGVIGLGGGSSLDTAKIVALLVNSTQTLDEVYGENLARGMRLPLIQVPTTAGTGSEVTWVSVVTNDRNEKKVVFSPQMLPDLALLDATLTVGMPAKITAATALDAMVHAIEAYTSRTKKNPVSDAFARKALELIAIHLPAVLENGQNLEARAAVLNGAMFAGMSFINASVAAIHGLAYPLGARFHIPHGHANALVMGPVLRFNLKAAQQQYAELAASLLPGSRFTSEEEAAEAFVATMEKLSGCGGLETKLSRLGVGASDIFSMADEVVTQIQRLIATNPCDMSYEDVVAIYQSIL